MHDELVLVNITSCAILSRPFLFSHLYYVAIIFIHVNFVLTALAKSRLAMCFCVSRCSSVFNHFSAYFVFMVA